MRRTTLIAVSFGLLLSVLTGCDGDPDTDNGRLTVHNQSAATIQLHYDEEVERGDGAVERVRRHRELAAGQTTVIYVDTWFWDGEVTVVRHGVQRVYDLDFPVSGILTLTIRAADFARVDAVALPMGDA
ncbi:MAG: hypothetical protein ACOCXA_04385 [Planctomycetota bacterium]